VELGGDSGRKPSDFPGTRKNKHGHDVNTYSALFCLAKVQGRGPKDRSQMRVLGALRYLLQFMIRSPLRIFLDELSTMAASPHLGLVRILARI
jgi:hypothetical protein